MAASINFNTKDFDRGIDRLKLAMKAQNRKALTEIAMEALRLTTFEVPHDTGMLQASGSVQQLLGSDDTVVMGYNKVYAARLHEHPEYHFQKGRKGKYVEDPIKNNLRVFRQYYSESMKEMFR